MRSPNSTHLEEQHSLESGAGPTHNGRRILILNHFNSVSPRVLHEIQVLRAQGCEIQVLSWARSRQAVPSEAPDGVSQETVYHSVPKGAFRLLFHLPLLYLKIINRLRKRDFDVIHCTHIMFLPLMVFWGRLRGAKTIYDAYEFHLQETADRLPKPLRWLVPLLRRLEELLVQNVDGVLTIDSHDNELERRYRARNNNVASLYNVPDLDYPLDENKLDCLHQRYLGRQIVLYIGGISVIKGALQAIEGLNLVAQKMPNVLFMFVGMFHGQTESAFWERVRSNKLEENVEFISWLPYNEMLHYVAISKVGLALHQPISRYHMLGKGNGRKFFTYMQFGIPIVAPEFGELAQVVRDERCGLLIDTTDAREIADAITYLLENPEDAKTIGERGKKAIREKYNWGIEQQKLIEVYQNVERKK